MSRNPCPSRVGRLGHARSLAGACLLLLMLMHSAAGQSIELTREVAPPRPASPSLAASVVTVLEREAAEFIDQATTTSDSETRSVLMTKANVRLLAAELLASSDRDIAGDELSEFVRGMKLAVARTALDELIVPVADSALDGAVHSRERALGAFNRAFADHLAVRNQVMAERAHGSEHDWLARLLSHLLPVVTADSSTPLRSHWVGSVRAGTAAAPNDETAIVARIERLRGRIEAAPLDASARDHLRTIIDFLDRGRHFADLSSRVHEHAMLMGLLLDSVEVLAANEWLTEEVQRAWLADATTALELFQQPDRRDDAVLLIDRCAAMSRVVIAGTQLVADNIKAADMAAVASAITAQRLEAHGSSDVDRSLSLATATLDSMVKARAITDDRAARLTRELRTIERSVLKEYRTVESNVLKELASGSLFRASISDPELSSLLFDHRQRVEDLQRLRRLPVWNDAVNRLYPPAAKDFEVRMRRVAGELTLPTKLPEARATLDRFDVELMRFETLPYEQSLIDNSPTAIRLTGGLHAELVTCVKDARRAWINDWSHPTPTPGPSRTMALLHDLLTSLRDAATLVEFNAEVLNRWPPWQLSEQVIAAGQSDVQTRVRLACAAAATRQADGEMDIASLSEHIARLQDESPVTQLAGRLMTLLGNQLRECEAGALGALAQLVVEPEKEAMLRSHEDDLARICRFAAEASHARDAGDGGAASACQEYVDALARRVLERLED